MSIEPKRFRVKKITEIGYLRVRPTVFVEGLYQTQERWRYQNASRWKAKIEIDEMDDLDNLEVVEYETKRLIEALKSPLTANPYVERCKDDNIETRVF